MVDLFLGGIEGKSPHFFEREHLPTLNFNIERHSSPPLTHSPTHPLPTLSATSSREGHVRGDPPPEARRGEGEARAPAHRPHGRLRLRRGLLRQGRQELHQELRIFWIYGMCFVLS